MPQYRKLAGWPVDKSRANIYRALPKSPGIYMIRFRSDRRAYVGSSVNVSARLRAHLLEICNGKYCDDSHCYSPDEIEVVVLETVDDPAHLETLERQYIQKLSATFTLLNKIKPGRTSR